jgi:hypothetical protein
MTIVLFAPSGEVLQSNKRCLPLDASIMATSSWALTRGAAAAAECVVVVALDRSGAERFDVRRALAVLRSEHPSLAIVCATEGAALRRALLADRTASEVVRAADGPFALRAGVESARTAALLARSAARMSEARAIGGALSRALVHLMTQDPPPPTVNALAEATGIHRRTLWYQWVRRARGASVRLEDVVTWVVLLRGCVRRARGMPWTAAAAELGVDRKTLARAAARCGITPLPDLAARQGSAQGLIRQAFSEKVLGVMWRG